jgi:branched-chain amino acid aminotransferase
VLEARLYAVTPEGPRRVESPPGAGSVHELFDRFPIGVYSGLRSFHHRRFLRLDLHLARVRDNLQRAGWADFDELALRRALDRCCEEWPGEDARIRFDVLSEAARVGEVESRVWVALSELTPPSPRQREQGVRIELSDQLSRERPRIKLTDFVLRRRPHPIGTDRRYELVMLDREGRLLEGTTSNFFAVLDGVLRTAGGGVLAGITRQILLELAEGLGIPTRLEAVSREDLPRLSEAFVSSSTRALVPVVEIGELRVGDGRPGALTRRLLAAYEDYAERMARGALEPEPERLPSPRD